MNTIVRGCQLWLVAMMLFAASAQAQPRYSFDATPGILAKDIVPSEYRLALDLDPAKDTFTGVVDIALTIEQTHARVSVTDHGIGIA